MRKKIAAIMIGMLIGLPFIPSIGATPEPAVNITTGTEESSTENIIELPPAFQRGLPSAGITPDSWLYGFKECN